MSGGLVLEVGSGHRPDARATVLVDRFLSDDEREGRLVVDRPTVIADAAALPFPDMTFSLVIAKQLLEHVSDPGLALSEFDRVAAECHLEVPSPLMEAMLRVRPFHRWVIALRRGEAIGWPVSWLDKSSQQGALFELLYEKNWLVYTLVRGHPAAFLDSHIGPTPQFRLGDKAELEAEIQARFTTLVRPGARAQALALVKAVWVVGQQRFGRSIMTGHLIPRQRRP